MKTLLPTASVMTHMSDPSSLQIQLKKHKGNCFVFCKMLFIYNLNLYLYTYTRDGKNDEPNLLYFTDMNINML